jgi:hypothetical protein
MNRRGLPFLALALLALTTACSRPAAEPEGGPQPQADAPATDCRHDIDTKECEQAQASLTQDATALAAESAAARARDAQSQNDDAQAAALMSAECRLQEQTLAVLMRRQRGEGEILTDDERAQLPVEIERVQAYLDTHCK